ncbi:TlpA disulfide reductase family protein [Bacteroides sp. 224]|uniref:TlpA disulfide reductase family protein n=1 Tax=Bacteroides sp. 224 TaxID=2302936 RepID=UPI0013D324F2|nr:TlpA disulfide reductase family protein [Bacteroides sp. 224]NDV65957.1 DUF4369 domain-containing protein [Bacteroides sp. 224]
MKKLFILWVAVAMLLLPACKQASNKHSVESSSYEIKGKLNDSTYHGKTVYLVRHDDNVKIDSTVIVGVNYVFKGTTNDVPTYCSVVEGRANFGTLILENAVIDMSCKDSLSTSLNMELAKMQKATAKQHQAEATERTELFKKVTEPMEKKRQNILLRERSSKVLAEIYKSYFLANSNNEVGVVALMGYENYGNKQELAQLIAKAGEAVLSRQRVERIVKLNAAYMRTDIGKPFVDFTIDQGDGTTKSFSDYVGKGKYVLVDFWASWCGPCLAEVPVVTEVYEKYKGDKFEVLGVAVWDELEKTKAIFEKYKMPWPHILNTQKVPGELYGFQSIPHIILFAPDGTVVARGLRGEELKAKVAEVMQK